MKKFMKSIQMMAALLVAVAATTACTNDDNIADSDIQPESTTGQYTLTVRATKGSDAALTRALGFDGTGALNATWTTGDKVLVKEYNADLTYGKLTATVDAGNPRMCTFSGSLDGVPSVGDKLTLMFNGANCATQKGTLETIATTCDYATADVSVSEVNTETKTIVASDATFENQYAIVKFSLMDKGNSNAALSTSQLTVGYGSSSINVMLDNPASDIFVAVPPMSSKDVVLTAVGADCNYIYEKTGVTFEKGKYYTIGVKMTSRALYSKPLNMVTAAEIGWRIGSDGRAYEPTGNLPTGVTAVAMICYISSTGHGLAIEINDNPSTSTFSDASSTATAGKPSIAGCTWRLPSFEDWFKIIIGCAEDGDRTPTYEGVKVMGLAPIRGFKHKCLVIGSPFKYSDLSSTKLWGRDFWTSNPCSANTSYAVTLHIYKNELDWANAIFNEMSAGQLLLYVLACLEF